MHAQDLRLTLPVLRSRFSKKFSLKLYHHAGFLRGFLPNRAVHRHVLKRCGACMRPSSAHKFAGITHLRCSDSLRSLLSHFPGQLKLGKIRRASSFGQNFKNPPGLPGGGVLALHIVAFSLVRSRGGSVVLLCFAAGELCLDQVGQLHT